MMKPPMLLPVISFLLVFAAISAPDAVCGIPFDSEGNEVLPNVPYYIVPATSRGGFSPYNLINKTIQLSCPVDLIVQVRFSSGVPVVFTPQNSSLKVIPVSHNLNIHSRSVLWYCTQSKVWTVKLAPITRRRVVSTGCTFHSPSSWFRIERHGDAYKLVHCQGGSPPCRDIGIGTVGASGRRFLAPSNRAFAVRFRRASLTDPSEEAISEEAVCEEAVCEEAIAEEATLRMFPLTE